MIPNEKKCEPKSEAQRTAMMALSCNQKTISIIKSNNFQTSWWFLLSELPSFFYNRKKVELHNKVCENKDFCNVIWGSTIFHLCRCWMYNRKDWWVQK